MIIKPGIDLSDARNWPPMGTKSLSGYQKKRLFHNEKGQAFTDQAPKYGVDSIRDGRGIATADFDNDGKVDMFVANANGKPFLYRNTMPNAGHWVEFALTGAAGGSGPPDKKKSNRLAVGAQVRVTAGGRTQLRFVDGGNSFAGQGSMRLHFGLGAATTIDKVEVRWPTGEKQTLTSVPVDKLTKIIEGSTK